MDDELVAAEIAQLLNLDRMGSHRREAVLVSLARSFGVFERRHSVISTVSRPFRFRLTWLWTVELRTRPPECSGCQPPPSA